MTPCSNLSVLAVIVLCVAEVTGAEGEAGFVSMFHGKDPLRNARYSRDFPYGKKPADNKISADRKCRVRLPYAGIR
jgi:hypothetical protein